MRFLLIHGGFHGAWCWRDLIPTLAAAGHTAVAIDLPGHGERRDEPSNLANRAEAIAEAVEPGDVLVGHSGGGFDISLAANLVPERIAHLVYLAAGLPIEGKPLLAATGGTASDDKVEQLSEGMPSTLKANARGRLEWSDVAAAWRIFYHDCDEATARWAVGLYSPAPPDILVDPVSIPAFWHAELPRSYIVCLEDRALPFASSMATAGRLGVVPHFIAGSHSPFFSRPGELARLLVTATGDRPVAPLRPY